MKPYPSHNDMILISVGRMCRMLRLTKKWTQRDLATKSGICWQFISDIERGRRNITLLTLQRLAYTLEVDIAFFFQDIDDE